jgi:hypothetical protein
MKKKIIVLISPPSQPGYPASGKGPGGSGTKPDENESIKSKARLKSSR